MRRRWKILVMAACGLIAVVVICFFGLREQEPSYNGRSLSEWLDNFDKSRRAGRGWPADPNDAADAISCLGESNAPLFAHWLVDGGSTAWRVIREEEKYPFVHWIADPLLLNPAMRKGHRGMLGLKILGTNARPAIPILTSALHESDPSVVEAVSNALFHIAPEVLTNHSTSK